MLAHGQLAAEHRVLRQGRQPALEAGRVGRPVEHDDLAPVGAEEAAHDREEGGLAGAVGADEGEDRAARDAEVDVAEGVLDVADRHLDDYSEARLWEPAYNLDFGAWYLAGFNGDFGDADKGRFHYIGPPEPVGERALSYTVDLGRASFEAIEDLVRRLVVLNTTTPVRRVLFGNGYLPD